MVHHIFGRLTFSPLTENTLDIIRFEKEEGIFFNEKDLDLRIAGYIPKEEGEKKCSLHDQIILTCRKLYMTVNSTACDNFSVKVNCSTRQTAAKAVNKKLCSNCFLETKLNTQPKQHSLVCS